MLISLNASRDGYGAVQKLFEQYVSRLEIYAGRYCAAGSLRRVIAAFPKNKQVLLRRGLWRDAEVVSHWATLNAKYGPNEHRQAIHAADEFVSALKHFKTAMARARSIGPLCAALNQNHFLHELTFKGNEVKGGNLQQELPDQVGRYNPKLAKKLHARTARDLDRMRESYLDVWYQGDTEEYFLSDGDVRPAEDYPNAIRELSRKIDVWEAVAVLVANDLHDRHVNAQSSTSASTGRGDRWSRPAICLLACCWKERLSEVGIVAPLTRSKLPQAMAFRAYVHSALSRVDFPNLRKRGFRRQTSDVLSGMSFEVDL